MKNIKNSLIQLYEVHQNLMQGLETYDEVWFIGDLSASFDQRASSVADRLKNFKGVVVGSINKEKRSRISNQLGGKNFWGFLDIESIIKRSKYKSIIIADFNDSIAGKMFANHLSQSGVQVCDYIKILCQLGMSHTYVPIQQEREFYLNNLDKFIELINQLTDNLSKETVIARIKTLFTLDRRWLMNVAQGNNHFDRFGNSIRSLIISDNETYIDVGAAHGDTVSKFFNDSAGKYNHIHAFEPDPINYSSLKKLIDVIPNSNCYNLGVSDQNGEMAFHEDENNRFGSRFEPSNTQSNFVKIARLDDVIDKATLIKIDVEGFENRVLKGAEKLIKEYSPAMHIAGYHYPEDILSIIETVHNIHRYKNIAIRHCDGSLYDTNILFSQNQNFQ